MPWFDVRSDLLGWRIAKRIGNHGAAVKKGNRGKAEETATNATTKQSIVINNTTCWTCGWATVSSFSNGSSICRLTLERCTITIYRANYLKRTNLTPSSLGSTESTMIRVYIRPGLCRIPRPGPGFDMDYLLLLAVHGSKKAFLINEKTLIRVSAGAVSPHCLFCLVCLCVLSVPVLLGVTNNTPMFHFISLVIPCGLICRETI